MDKYISDFICQIYPDYTELVMHANTEKECIIDATNLIKELRDENIKLKSVLQKILDGEWDEECLDGEWDEECETKYGIREAYTYIPRSLIENALKK